MRNNVLIEVFSYFRRNKFTTLSLIILILWKLFLVDVIWSGRATPPEADDSYVYLANIESVRRCDSLLFCADNLYPLTSPVGYDRLTYRLFLGSLGRLLNLSTFDTYKISFYLGSPFLAIGLLLFIKSFKIGDKQTAFYLIIMALFHGTGAYHGFYWVVPSFYSLTIFLYVFSIVNRGSNKWYLFLLLLIPLGVYTHLMFFYLLAILPLYALIFSVISKRFDSHLFNRTVIALLIGLISYVPSELYLHLNSKPYSYGIVSNINSISSYFGSNRLKTETTGVVKLTFGDYSLNFYSLSMIYDQYIRYFVKYWPVGMGFIFLGYYAFRHRSYQIISLYFSSLIFLGLSSINQFGYRSLIFVWPLTFLVYGAGSYYFIYEQFLKQRKAVSLFAIICTILFGLLNVTYSYLLNKDINDSHAWDVDPKITDYIRGNIPSRATVYYNHKIADSFLGFTSMYKYFHRVNNINEACYYFTGQKISESFSNSGLSKLIQIFSGEQISQVENSQPELQIPGEFKYLSRFGSFVIYYRPDCRH